MPLLFGSVIFDDYWHLDSLLQFCHISLYVEMWIRKYIENGWHRTMAAIKRHTHTKHDQITQIDWHMFVQLISISAFRNECNFNWVSWPFYEHDTYYVQHANHCDTWPNEIDKLFALLNERWWNSWDIRDALIPISIFSSSLAALSPMIWGHMWRSWHGLAENLSNLMCTIQCHLCVLHCKSNKTIVREKFCLLRRIEVKLNLETENNNNANEDVGQYFVDTWLLSKSTEILWAIFLFQTLSQ